MAKPLDPKNVNGRIYNQVAELLTQLEEGEHITLKERVAALMAVSRIQYVFVQIRKEKATDDDAGTAVRKYAGAFSKNDPGGGKKGRGRPALAAKPEPDDWFEHAELDDDDSA